MCKGAIFSLFQYLVPQHFLSRCAAKLANSQRPKLKNYLILKFVKHFKVNLSEAERENPADYLSFNDFFTRALKPAARPIPSDPNILISPADGEISQIGQVDAQGRIFQAKGRSYSLLELLGGEFKEIQAFQNSYFSTIYLAPKDYHRVHMPMDGELLAMTYCPGQLFSVNPTTAENIPDLFARNERAAIFFQTEHGKMAIVFVGAMLVAGIETVFSGVVSPSSHSEIQHFCYQENLDIKKQFKRGDELGRFQFGSTVIVLHESAFFKFEAELSPKKSIQMGQKIGRFEKNIS
jgi:phosphatidylserine decarboxylase